MFSLIDKFVLLSVNLFVLLTCCLAIKQQDCECNHNLNNSFSIYPWQVYVNPVKSINFNNGCSAIILNENYLLMASHCNEYFRNDYTNVTFPTEQANNKSRYFHKYVKIQKWYSNIGYNFKKNNLYDLSILKLQESLIFDRNSSLKPACFEKMYKDTIKSNLTASGVYNKEDKFLKVWQEAYEDVSKNCTTELICAKAKTICENELGFVLHQEDELGKLRVVGLKAIYIQDKKNDACLVTFTRLSFYTNWIKEIANEICLV